MTKNEKHNPLPNRPNRLGRDAKGRFIAGCAGGPGNPHARQVAKLRSALLAAVTPADIRAIVKALVKQARGGDIMAIRELLDRAIGKPQETDFLEKLDQLEHILNELAKSTQ